MSLFSFWLVFLILLWLHHYVTVTSKIRAAGCKMHTLLLSFPLLRSLFFSFFYVISSRCPSCPLLHPPVTVTVTCVLRPRRSVSRSQQWKQSLSSTQSGPSRSQKKSRASWMTLTSRRQRSGEWKSYFSVFLFKRRQMNVQFFVVEFRQLML